MSTKFPKPTIIDRRTKALGYPGHGAYARRNKSAIKNIVWHYTATTHSGYGEANISSHENYWKNTHGWEIGGYAYYIDRLGNIFWNYDLSVVTYGAGSTNPYTMHISLEASSPSNYTAAQVKSREALTLWLMSSELPHLNGKSMRGHFEMPGNSTACPGYTVSQLNQFRNNLDVKLKAGSTGGETNNPQGLVEIKIPTYQAPKLPFTTLKVGDKVTFEKGWKWYNPSTNKLMNSKREAELTGQTDKIVEIKDIDDVGNSRFAYRVAKYNSWILEEYVEESKSGWTEIEAPKDLKVPEYREPSQPFTELSVGQKVTIRPETQNWFVPSTKEWVAPTVNIKGETDEIAKVIEIEGGASYSKRAYLLKGFHSWLLEQDFVEARLTDKSPDPVEVPVDETVDETPEVQEEGIFKLNDKWYQITEILAP